MKSILFVDPVCPSPYTHLTALEGPQGGTEATVARVGYALSKSFLVGHLQRNRSELDRIGDVVYDRIDSPLVYNPEIVITLRDAIVYRDMRTKYPNAKHYLWLHDVVSGEYREHLNITLKGLDNIRIIAVSKWHTFNILSRLDYLPGLEVTAIYPPLAEYCVRSGKEYDPFKLVFFSSPHKGLDQVLEVFNELRKHDVRFRLILANPGYYSNADISIPGVENRGALSHPKILDEVQSALCTLYCQTVFEETFGLVMAESMAVGTPVIVHNIGAASEVVDHPNCIVNCLDSDAVVKRVLAWSQGERPTVAAQGQFKIDAVAQEWKKCFNK